MLDKLAGILMLSLGAGTGGSAADGWISDSPREELRPVFSVESQSASGKPLVLEIAAGGREAIDGAWIKTFPIEGGRFYRFSALRKTIDVISPESRRARIIPCLRRGSAKSA